MSHCSWVMIVWLISCVKTDIKIQMTFEYKYDSVSEKPFDRHLLSEGKVMPETMQSSYPVEPCAKAFRTG